MSVLAGALWLLSQKLCQLDFGSHTVVATTHDELQFLRKNLGPALARMQMEHSFESRRDIDKLVSNMLNRFYL